MTTPLIRPHACPCGGAAPDKRASSAPPAFAICCGRFIDAGERAPRALELMRSRYSAYVLGEMPYLRATWEPRTCPADFDRDPTRTRATHWLGLQIKHYAQLDTTHAEVEFVARYKISGRAYRLHETSRFTYTEQSGWRYVDGDIHPS